MPSGESRADVAAAAVDVAPVRAIGGVLQSARERRGVTLVQAAERLRVDVGVLTALEQERFDSLGAPVYVRGHLRRYAEFLGEPDGALQALYAGLHESSVEPDLTQAPRVTGRQPPRSLLWPLVLGLGVVVLVGIVWFGLGAQPAP
jgi:cytoskeletal protein RodZ